MVAGMAELTEAVRLLEEGDWEAAHVIAQENSSARGSWAHGIVHLMEGDLANARYWYRRAGRDLQRDWNIADELHALKQALTE